MEPLQLSNRVIAITGASRGLGAGLARVAARAGASLALCSRGTPALGEAGNVLAMRLDVTDAPAVERFVAAAFDRFGGVDLFINNAGVVEPVGPLRTLEPEALHRLIDVNVLGVALGSRAYLRELHGREQRGVILNISSGAARNAYYGWSGYCASKAAVDRLSEAIALEEHPRVAVYSAAPGVVDTDMQTSIRDKTEDEFRDVARFRELHARRALATPEEAAERLLRFALDPDSARGPVCVDLR